jgi:hypothetical protein
MCLSINIKIHKTVILPVVLYECETWSVTLWKYRLRVFKYRVLRKMFGLKRKQVTGICIKLHNEELHDLYTPQPILMVELRMTI